MTSEISRLPASFPESMRSRREHSSATALAYCSGPIASPSRASHLPTISRISSRIAMVRRTSEGFRTCSAVDRAWVSSSPLRSR